jgi:hypothetical protein
MKNVRQFLSIGVFGLVSIGSVIPAAASTMNLSTGTAAYMITADSNGEGFSPVPVTPLPAGWVSTLSDGIGDSGVWIAPTAGQAGESTSVSGSTTYQVNFSLSGLNPATAVLTINLTGDDYVEAATLNGHNIFMPTSTDISSGMWTTSSGTFVVNDLTGDFNPTTNMLVFVVPNNSSDNTTSCCGPTGLDVAASVTASAVPEPSATLPLALAALTGGLALRRRTRSAR